MSGGGGGEKTEQATPKKLKDLRKKGSSARSIDLPAGVSLLALALVLPWMVGRLLDVFRTDMAVALSGAGVADLGTAREMGHTFLLDAGRAVAPAVAIVGLTALISGSAVTRSRPNPAVIKPQWARLSPKKSLKNLVGSSHGLVELLRNTIKIVLLTAVTLGAWQSGYEALLAAGGDLAVLQSVVGAASSDVLLRTALLAVLVGIADAAWQRKVFRKQSRMSKQEVSEEHKQADGNPHTKGAIRSRQLSVSRNRMIAAVPKADVVLANPTHLVVALAYEPGSLAPVVVAKGAGAAADRIKAVAAEAGVPVIADKPLARAIYRGSEVGDTIPAELYRVVAELLAVVYSARRRNARPVWSGRAA